MPPKIRITKEDILSTAVEIVRQEGAAALNARAIASSLHCSTQPIFSNFETMDVLRAAVIGSSPLIADPPVTAQIFGFHCTVADRC